MEARRVSHWQVRCDRARHVCATRLAQANTEGMPNRKLARTLGVTCVCLLLVSGLPRTAAHS